MDPPVNPPEEIDDPEDSKPEDWVRGPSSRRSNQNDLIGTLSLICIHQRSHDSLP